MILSICVVIISTLIVFFFTKYKFCSLKNSVKYSIGYNEVCLINNIFKYLFPILLLSILFGFRYNIGTDYPVYKEIYETAFSGNLRQSIEESGVECLYALISHILCHMNMPYYIMFFFMAMIPMIFFCIAFKDKPFLIGYATFFLAATGVLFWFFNIQRQGIAFFILLFSVKYIINKNFWKFLICIIVATGFHISSILFIFCYLFAYFKQSLIFNTTILSVIYILFWIFSPFLIEILIKFSSIFLVGKYSYYINSIQSWEMGIGSGLGILSMHIIDLIIILTSSTMFNYFKGYRYDVYFRIFYSGALLANIAGINMVLSRLPFCFLSMRVILLSFFTYYIVKNWKCITIYKKIMWTVVMGLSILLLIGNAYNNPYEFIPSL